MTIIIFVLLSGLVLGHTLPVWKSLHTRTIPVLIPGLHALGSLNVLIGAVLLLYDYPYGIIAIIGGALSISIGAVLYDIWREQFTPEQTGLRAGISTFIVGLALIYL